MQIRPAKPEDATAIADYILLAMQDLAFKFSNNKDVSLTHDLFQNSPHFRPINTVMRILW